MELNSCARSFSFNATPKLPGNASLQNFHPGQKIQITIGDDLVLSGYIDTTPVSYSASSVSLTVSGRSKTCDLVDCSVYPKDQNIAFDQSWSGAGVYRIPSSGSVVSCPDVSAISWRGQQLGTILAQLVKPYGVRLINQGQDLSAVLNYDVTPEQTVLKALQDLTKKYDLWLCDDPNGDLVVTKKGYTETTERLILGQNVLEGSASFDASKLFETYQVLGQTKGTNTSFGAASSSDPQAFETNFFKRRRFTCKKAEGQTASFDCLKQAQSSGNYDKAQYSALSYKVQGWRHITDGRLWKINTLVGVEDTLLSISKASGRFLITKVTFNLSDGGMTTDLELIPPEGVKQDEEKDRDNKKSSGKKSGSKSTTQDLGWIEPIDKTRAMA